MGQKIGRPKKYILNLAGWPVWAVKLYVRCINVMLVRTGTWEDRAGQGGRRGTPTKRQVSKRQVSTVRFQNGHFVIFTSVAVLKPYDLQPDVLKTWRFVNLTFCRPDVSNVLKPDVLKPDVLKPDVLKPDVLKPDVLKPDVLWVYRRRGQERGGTGQDRAGQAKGRGQDRAGQGRGGGGQDRTGQGL